MKRTGHIMYALVLLVSIVLSSCQKEDLEPIVRVKKKTEVDQPILPKRDLEEIKRSGKLVLLTENTSTSYYLYKGQPLGYDYEWAEKFAKHLNVKLEVRLVDNLNDMFDLLQRGEGDLLSCNLNITGDRAERATFSIPLYETRYVIVQKIQDALKYASSEALDTLLIRDPKDLIRKEVFVHEYTAFNEALNAIEDQYMEPIYVIPASGYIGTEQMLRLVSKGQIGLTVADENLARLNKSYYPNIDVQCAISGPKPVAAAVRTNQPLLIQALNKWLQRSDTKRSMDYLYRKYFLMPRSQSNRVLSPYSSIFGDKISIWDDAVKRESAKIGWDWKLISALINQESRFDPDARSWMGAKGLMQLMPATAERFGALDSSSAEQNIRAGVAYLEYLERFWTKRLDDTSELQKFVLASYNVGPGHVLDARKIAVRENLDPNVWDNSVDKCLLMKEDPAYYTQDYVKFGYCRGTEPYHYVQDILNTYDQYSAVN